MSLQLGALLGIRSVGDDSFSLTAVGAAPSNLRSTDVVTLPSLTPVNTEARRTFARTGRSRDHRLFGGCGGNRGAGPANAQLRMGSLRALRLLTSALSL